MYMKYDRLGSVILLIPFVCYLLILFIFGSWGLDKLTDRILFSLFCLACFALGFNNIAKARNIKKLSSCANNQQNDAKPQM